MNGYELLWNADILRDMLRTVALFALIAIPLTVANYIATKGRGR